MFYYCWRISEICVRTRIRGCVTNVSPAVAAAVPVTHLTWGDVDHPRGTRRRRWLAFHGSSGIKKKKKLATILPSKCTARILYRNNTQVRWRFHRLDGACFVFLSRCGLLGGRYRRRPQQTRFYDGHNTWNILNLVAQDT